MKAIFRGLMAAAVLASVGTAASAQSLVYQFDITNPTGIDWKGIFFELKPRTGASYPAGSWAQVQFVSDLTRQTSTRPILSTVLSPDGQTLTFNFPVSSLFKPSDPVATFIVEFNNPQMVPVRIGYTPVFIPAPGAGALAGAAGLLALRRRRR
ncbi:MAG: hypothetical protein IBJ11_07530 [Phycisphaerales bacterium]|nr:hypothetical protein [Phycisphaerales bacterium]